MDNIPIERFWRTLKYEEVYLKTYETVFEAKAGIAAYIHWYNHQRRHTGLNKNRPHEVMTGQKKAEKWPFSKIDGYVDNGKPLTHRSTISTTTTQEGNLSSTIAA